MTSGCVSSPAAAATAVHRTAARFQPGQNAHQPGSAVVNQPGTPLRARARLDHQRAVLAARLWFAASPAWGEHQGWWQSERRIRRKGPAAGRHRPDAEIWWPSIDGSPYAGQVWAIEVELTAKHAARTAAIMEGLTAPAGYAQVLYLTAPAARGVVARCADALPWRARRPCGTCPRPPMPRICE